MVVFDSVFGEEEIYYRTIGQDEKEEELFRIIQEIKEDLSRLLQEKKAKLLSWGTRVDRLELWDVMMPLLGASTANSAVQRRKNKKRRERITSAMSSSNVRLGTSDPNMQNKLQGQTIGSWKLINETSTAQKRKDQGIGLHAFGVLIFTGPGIKGLFLTILLVSSTSLSSGQNHERPTYCHVGQELITQDWKLSCKFPVDIRERRQAFQVFQVKRDGSPDLVVDGTWIEDELKAFTADGYDVDGPVSDEFVIRMQSHVVHSGQVYTCTLPSTPLENIKTCQVHKITPMLNLLQDVHNGARGSVNYEKMLLLITAAITYGIICRHI